MMAKPQINEEKLKQGRLAVLRQSLVHVTGCADSALVLGQMIYWQQRATQPGGWFWKSAEELSGEIYCLFKAGKIGNLLMELCDRGLLERQRDPTPKTHRYRYRVLADKVNEALESFVPDSPPSSPGADGTSPDARTMRTRCGSNREHSNQNGIDCPSPISNFLEPEAAQPGAPKGERPKGSASCSDSRGTAAMPDDGAVAAYMPAVDRALQQALAIASGVIWNRLGREFTQDRRFDAVFGKSPSLAWTQQESGYLAEIADFCHQKWPELDCVALTAGLVRATFHPQGKPFQLLRYWSEFGHGRISLRPWVHLSGRGDDHKFDFLQELAATPAAQRFLQRLSARGAS